MKFTLTKTDWGADRFKGQKNGFVFEITDGSGNNKGTQFYIFVNHQKKDIRYNTLWEDLLFTNLEAAKDWCINFDYKKQYCLGTDSYLKIQDKIRNNGSERTNGNRFPK